MQSDSIAWLRWVLVPNLGLKRSHQLLELVDSPQALFLHPDRWPLPDNVKHTLREMNLLGEQHPVHRRALEQLHWQQAHDSHQLIFMHDTHYPEKLAAINDAPLVLWGKGNPALLQNRQVGIVGSRQASANALRHTREISKSLSLANLTVCSGGAAGIDTAAHSAALHGTGTTVAVLGCGIDVVYPKSNRSLFSDIEKQGLLVSEYPLGTQPRPGHFPRRNRLISALADIILVIEAALKSGSLITAQHALEQGKDIFAMPGDIGNPNCEGCHKLIQDGAFLLSDAEDILRHLAWNYSASSIETGPDISVLLNDCSPIQQSIIRLLQCDQQPIDALAHALNVKAHQLLEPILELELSGIIQQQPGGYTLAML